jgi:hypothetical protein
MARISFRKSVIAAALVLGAGAIAIGLLGSKSAEALPGQDVTHVYFFDAEHTQYAGEEWVMTCRGAPPGGGLMIDGVRADHYTVITDRCDGSGINYTCRKCEGINGYPIQPRCNPPYPWSAVCPNPPIP